MLTPSHGQNQKARMYRSREGEESPARFRDRIYDVRRTRIAELQPRALFKDGMSKKERTKNNTEKC